MKYEQQIISRVRPANVVRGPTITWYYYDIEEYEIPVEMGEGTISGYRYNGICFNAGEYEGVQEGRLPSNVQSWDAKLWAIFVEHQHSLTDVHYINAQMHLRNSEAGWTEYVASLDSWNNEIDNRDMGDTHATPIPVEPGKKV